MTYNIIKTENYLLVVDDSEIKEGDIVLETYVDGTNGLEQIDTLNDIHPLVHKKIIAHLPLNDSPILESVVLLPPLPVEDAEKLGMHDLESYYGSNLELTAPGRMWVEGFDIGYNKAKEKYKYTEEDLRRMFSRAWELRDRYKNLDYDEREEFFFQKELKSLSKYPIGFECEMETKFEWVGNYIF